MQAVHAAEVKSGGKSVDVILAIMAPGRYAAITILIVFAYPVEGKG